MSEATEHCSAVKGQSPVGSPAAMDHHRSQKRKQPVRNLASDPPTAGPSARGAFSRPRLQAGPENRPEDDLRDAPSASNLMRVQIPIGTNSG